MLSAAFIVLITAIVDALYAVYTRYVVSHKAVLSASSGALIHLLNAYVVFTYTHDWRYIGCVVAGSWIGTYLMVRFGRSPAAQPGGT